jgi:hypothetical protein
MHKSHTKLSNQEFKIKQDWKNGMEDLLFGPWLLPARPRPKPKRRRPEPLTTSPVVASARPEVGAPRRSRPQFAQNSLAATRDEGFKEREGVRARGHWAPLRQSCWLLGSGRGGSVQQGCKPATAAGNPSSCLRQLTMASYRSAAPLLRGIKYFCQISRWAE